MNKSIKIFIKWFAGPVLAAWLFYSLYRQLRLQPDLGTAVAMIKQAPFGSLAWKFWIVIVLVFVNWGLEARKWQILVRAMEPIGFGRALKSVLCGVTFSLNLPNRMGEYAGRMLFLQEGNRLRSISLSIAGGIAQLIITMLMGCLGIAYLVFTYTDTVKDMGLSLFWLRIFLYGSIMGTILTCLFLFRLPWLIRLLEKLPGTIRFSRYISVLENFGVNFLLRLLLLSFLRYLVFVLQYILLLQVMQVAPDYWQSFWLVSLMFWVLAIIPSFAIAELGIRGTVAKTLFAFSNNLVGVLAVTFGIWFINLFIPAFLGSVLILSFKSNRKNETQP